MAQPTLGKLQMEANAVVSDLFIGRPGMESTIKDINTTQGYAGNLKMAVNDTVESIMTSSANGSEAVQEAIAEFEQAANAAANIYDNVHDVALEAFQEHPELMEELEYMVDSSLPESQMTPEHMANEIAGDIASQIWNSGNYVTIDDIKEALQNSDALDSNIHNAQQAAEAFIEEAQNYEPEHENKNEAHVQESTSYAASPEASEVPDAGQSEITIEDLLPAKGLFCQGNCLMASDFAARGPEGENTPVQRVDHKTGNEAEVKTAAERKINNEPGREPQQPGANGPDLEEPGLGLA